MFSSRAQLHTNPTVREARRGARGLTLLELLVSLLIFSFASLGLGRLFANNLYWNTRNERIGGASQAAQGALDSYRTMDIAALPSITTVQNSQVTVGKRTFDVATTICPAGTTYCNSSMREISVLVKYNGRSVYRVGAVYAQLQ